jgi:diguanylate cyclase (GGDEF)-like protein
LAGLLVAAGIPVIATVRILDSNALSNERARADSALRAELQSAAQTLGRLGDDASNRADDLSRSPIVQRAFLKADVGTLQNLARKDPGVVFYLQKQRVAGTRPAVALARSVSLTFNGQQVGTVEATVALDRRLGARLVRNGPHERSDRLVVVRRGVAIGTKDRFSIDGATVRLGRERYRGTLSPVPNATGVSLLVLRPDRTIAASVRPYQQRVMYAAAGSFALLVLLGLLFARPILRTLGDFRHVASQAVTDPLTGLANRRSFDEELALEWRRAERVGSGLALIFADIDDFKRVNDTYGHQKGDEVLRKVGEVLGAAVRQVDLAARYGGEEFAVIVPETDLGDALKLAERLRSSVMQAETELSDGTRLRVMSSFGVAIKGELGRAEDLIAAADEALYDAKRAGKNRVAPEVALEAERATAPQPERRRRKPASRTAATTSPAKAAAKKAKTPARKAPAKRRTSPKPRPAQGEI